MHLEHQARDLPSAESVTRSLLLEADDHEHAALEHRLRRIEQKRERRAKTRSTSLRRGTR